MAELLEKAKLEIVAGAEFNIDFMREDMKRKGMDMEKSMYDNLRDGLIDLTDGMEKEDIQTILMYFLNQLADNPVGYASFLRVDAMEGRMEDELGDFREFLQVYKEVAELCGAELPGSDEMIERCICSMRRSIESAHSKAVDYYI